MTKEEKKLWYNFLSCHSVRYMRQRVIGNYIADFYCAKAKLVIELDGSGHYTKKGKIKDEIRTTFLEEYGLAVIRIPNTEINENFYNVCEYINRITLQRISCK